MKYAADFREIARDALHGKWVIAVIVGLVASLLGGAGSGGPEVNVDLDSSGAKASFSIAGRTIYSTGGDLNSEIGVFLASAAVFIILVALVIGAIYFALGSMVEVGYARFNLELVDRQDPSFDTLFAYFSYWKTMVAAKFLRGLYVLLWSLLLFVPGIIARYSYAMTGYILAEHPELTASEAISRSKEMMSGNRWRLFCLQFSFIGWAILCAFTAGIGNFWLNPYKEAAVAAFYRDISETDHFAGGDA